MIGVVVGYDITVYADLLQKYHCLSAMIGVVVGYDITVYADLLQK